MARTFAEYTPEEKLAVMISSEADQRRQSLLATARKVECENLLQEALYLLQQAKTGRPYKRDLKTLQLGAAVYFGSP